MQYSMLFQNTKKNIEDKSSFNLVTEIAQPEKIEKKEELKATKQSQSENTKVKTAIGAGDKNVYYSVQIAASQRLLDTKPSNFKGEDQVFRISSGKIHRYFCGKYNSYNEALAAKTQLQLKFGDAFVVAFEDNKIVSVKKLTEKM